jgi:glycosyltransferase involved in cell wall biosynthesis
MRVLEHSVGETPNPRPRHGAALVAMTAAIRADLDLVTIKTESLSHVERIADARMFRVPVGDAGPLEQRVMFDRAVARQLEAERYDVVHVRGPFDGAIAAERKRALGFRLVYELATFPDEALGAEVVAGWDRAHATCLAEADLIVVPSDAARRTILGTVPAERVTVLPPGVDVGSFDWRPPSSGTAIPRLLYVGPYTPDRDLITVLGAMRRVIETREIRAMFAGDGDRVRRDQLRAKIEELGLARIADVRGEPPLRSLPQLINGASLCLAPASAAPRFLVLGDLPQPLLEYMACHRPVIAASVPGVADVLRDEEEGLLYPPGDEVALADAMLLMLRDTELRARVTEVAYRRVREHFSSGARRRRLSEIYERLAPGSQIVDPWDESFSENQTGEVQMPTFFSGMIETNGDTLVPEADDEDGVGDVDGGERTSEREVSTETASASEADGDSGSDPIEADTGDVMIKTQPGVQIAQEIAPRIDTDPGLRTEDTDPGA